MSIEISGAPTPARSPAFAGITVRVPLNKEPSRAWLDQLALQELPGKGHRLDGASIELYLDRGLTDVQAVMDRIAEAIAKTNTAYDGLKEELEREDIARTARRNGAIERVAKGLEQWWATRSPAPRELAAGDDAAKPA